MKKVLLCMASTLLLAVMLASCNSDGPKARAEKFLTAFYHMDYAAAKETATEDTRKLLSTIEMSYAKMVHPSKKEIMQKIKVAVKDPKIDGDNAIVEYTITNDPTPRTLRLVKEKGKWMAQFSKMDVRNIYQNNFDMGDGMPQDPETAPPAGPMPGDSVGTK